MLDGVGPHFPNPIRTLEDLGRINKEVDVDKELGYVYDAITLTRRKLDGRVPLFGFVGAPWTLFAYMIEGGGSKTLSKAKSWLFKHPKESHWLLQRAADVVVDFLVGQAKAGAQILQVFDSWGGELNQSQFHKFSLPYLTQIASRVKMHLNALSLVVPLVVFAKGVHHSFDSLSSIGYDVVSLDWTLDPKIVADVTKNRVVLQGNADPALLYAPKDVIRTEVAKMISRFDSGSNGHIANLGHGMHPDHDPEHLRVYLQAIRDCSTKK
jgi:uroporphyrinogen decarboxylase